MIRTPFINLSLLLAIWVLGSSCGVFNSEEIIQNPDGSITHRFANGLTCTRKADYTRFSKSKGAIAIRELFEAEMVVENKWENAKKNDPEKSELEAVFFDLCQKYGNNLLTREKFDHYNERYEEIRFKLFKEETKNKFHPIQNDMVKIPAGEFIMGTDHEEIDSILETFADSQPERWWFEDEHPKSIKDRGTFWIDMYEVSNEQYNKYMNAHSGVFAPETWINGKMPYGKEGHPVTGVSRSEAQKYCSSLGKRLPTEYEWEKAARGSEGRIYPWGNQPLGNDGTAKANTMESGRGETVGVGLFKYDQSLYGVFDMGGNVMEWVDDPYTPYPNNSPKEQKTKNTFRTRAHWAVARGGSFLETILSARGANRRYFSTGHRGKDIGFRCVRDKQMD